MINKTETIPTKKLVITITTVTINFTFYFYFIPTIE